MRRKGENQRSRKEIRRRRKDTCEGRSDCRGIDGRETKGEKVRRGKRKIKWMLRGEKTRKRRMT